MLSAIRTNCIMYFYPRSPCGERLAYPDMIICTNVISIHALLAESDVTLDCLRAMRELFLSTLSLRRATRPKTSSRPRNTISIHALLAESDGAVLKLQ